MKTTRSLGLLLCGVVAACGGGSTGEWSGTVTDSAGVAIVSNPTTGVWRGGQAWRVEESLLIGTTDGDPNYQFGAIVSLDVDASGRIYVLDQQAQNVRVYDADGTYLRTIGRPGSGPGELSLGAGAVLVGPGDTIFVPDAMQQRVNRFLPDGTEAGSFPLPMTAGLAIKWTHLPGGRFAQESRPLPMPMPGQQAAANAHVVLVRGTDGAVLDTLLRLPEGKTFQMQGSTPQIRLFEPEPVWDVWPDGSTVSASNADYRIEVRGPDGRLARVIKRSFDRTRVTEDDQQKIRKAMESLFDQQGVPPMVRQQLMQAISFADHYPAFYNVAAGPERSIWVQQGQTAETAAATGSFNPEDLGAAEWDVFDADGRFLGVVRFPERYRPVRFIGNDIYGVWRDELDVQHVMRLRIVGIDAVG